MNPLPEYMQNGSSDLITCAWANQRFHSYQNILYTLISSLHIKKESKLVSISWYSFVLTLFIIWFWDNGYLPGNSCQETFNNFIKTCDILSYDSKAVISSLLTETKWHAYETSWIFLRIIKYFSILPVWKFFWWPQLMTQRFNVWRV